MRPDSSSRKRKVRTTPASRETSGAPICMHGLRGRLAGLFLNGRGDAMTRTGFEYLLRIESLRDISSSFVAEQARFDSKVRFDLLGKCLDSKGGQKSGQLNGKKCPQLCPRSARGTAFLIRDTPAGNYLSKPQADGKGFTSLARPRLFLMKLSIHEGCLHRITRLSMLPGSPSRQEFFFFTPWKTLGFLCTPYSVIRAKSTSRNGLAAAVDSDFTSHRSSHYTCGDENQE